MQRKQVLDQSDPTFMSPRAVECGPSSATDQVARNGLGLREPSSMSPKPRTAGQGSAGGALERMIGEIVKRRSGATSSGTADGHIASKNERYTFNSKGDRT